MQFDHPLSWSRRTKRLCKEATAFVELSTHGRSSLVRYVTDGRAADGSGFRGLFTGRAIFLNRSYTVSHLDRLGDPAELTGPEARSCSRALLTLIHENVHAVGPRDIRAAAMDFRIGGFPGYDFFAEGLTEVGAALLYPDFLNASSLGARHPVLTTLGPPVTARFVEREACRLFIHGIAERLHLDERALVLELCASGRTDGPVRLIVGKVMEAAGMDMAVEAAFATAFRGRLIRQCAVMERRLERHGRRGLIGTAAGVQVGEFVAGAMLRVVDSMCPELAGANVRVQSRRGRSL